MITERPVWLVAATLLACSGCMMETGGTEHSAEDVPPAVEREAIDTSGEAGESQTDVHYLYVPVVRDEALASPTPDPWRPLDPTVSPTPDPWSPSGEMESETEDAQEVVDPMDPGSSSGDGRPDPDDSTDTSGGMTPSAG